MKYAICNELFTDPSAVAGEAWSWEQQCSFAAEIGYEGIEVAPFTLGDQPLDVSEASRAQMKAVAERAGVEVIGLHWLLAKTSGFHLTTADASVRQQTADYLGGLAELCRDLGGSVMVLGSPQQRNLQDGVTYQAAEENALDVISRIVPTLEDLSVTLCLEPLGPNETDFIQSCAAANVLIDRIGSERVRLHQDVKAMCHESTPIPELIASFAHVTAHFHANDENLRGPGMGDVDFHPIFAALLKSGYDGFVSVEVFDYQAGAKSIAIDSLKYMRAVEAACLQELA